MKCTNFADLAKNTKVDIYKISTDEPDDTGSSVQTEELLISAFAIIEHKSGSLNVGGGQIVSNIDMIITTRFISNFAISDFAKKCYITYNDKIYDIQYHVSVNDLKGKYEGKMYSIFYVKERA